MSEYPIVTDEYGRRVVESGAAAIYGIRLSEHPEVKDLLDKLMAYVAIVSKEDNGDWFDWKRGYHDATEDQNVQVFLPQFVKAFAKIGILIPPEAELCWTGREASRVAKAGGTPCNEFLIGFGLHTFPSDYPRVHRSFAAKARWHTWAWIMR
jgi:hypothetical protein